MKSKPVKIWALLGAGFLALQIYIFTSWLTSGIPQRTPTGPTLVPNSMRFAAVAWTTVGIAVSVLIVGYFILRPWLRDRTFPVDGYLILASISLYWQDPLENYFAVQATMNAAVPLQWGCWCSNIPGWVSPRGNLLPDSPLFNGFAYIYFWFLGALFANWLMRLLRRRRPLLSMTQLAIVVFVAMFAFDVAVEIPWLRFGIVTYPASPKWETLFSDHYYRYPIHEGLVAAAMLTIFSWWRFAHNDRGETVPERGLSDMRLSPRRSRMVRLLAFVGFANVIYLASFNIPVQWFGLHGDPWPRDIQTRSYLNDHFCGFGTSLPCPVRPPKEIGAAESLSDSRSEPRPRSHQPGPENGVNSASLFPNNSLPRGGAIFRTLIPAHGKERL